MQSAADALRQASLRFTVPVLGGLILRLILEPQLAGRAPSLGVAVLLIAAGIAVLDRFPLGTGARRLRWHAGLLFLFAINAGYQSTGRFMRTGAGWRADDLLHFIDIALLGGRDVQSWLSLFNQPWLTDLLAVCYAFFLVLLPVVSLYYVFAADTGSVGRYWRGLMTVYGAGFAGYLLLPAAGPYLHHPQELMPLAHGVVSAPIHAFIAQQSTGVDVWPSLHAAVTLYIQLWLWREVPRLGRLLALPSLLVVLSTMYLQYHYFIDVLCGVALAWVAARQARGELL